MALPVRYPVAHYFRCIDATDQPANYVGDWPESGKVYAGCVKPAAHTGTPHVHLDGFHAEKPWGAFARGRFAHFTTLYLN